MKALKKHYNDENDEGRFLEFDVQYHDKVHDPPNDLLFLPERIKIEKVKKLIVSLQDKNKYVIHLKNLEHALNYELFLRKVHKFIEFN